MEPEKEENGKKKTSKSRGKQCCVVECNNFEYQSDGSRSSVLFFKFPTKNPKRNRWCNRIKRQHGRDGFRVTENTVICQEHFKKEDIKKSLGGVRHRLKERIEPSLFNWSTQVSPKKRKPPCNRSSLGSPKKKVKAPTSRKKVKKAIVEDAEMPSSSGVIIEACTSKHDEQALSSPQKEVIIEDPYTPCLSMELPIKSIADKGTQTDFPVLSTDASPVLSNHTYAFSFDNEEKELNKSMQERLEVKEEMLCNLKAKVGQLQSQLQEYKERAFSLEKFQDDNSAIMFYTGSPNYDALIAFHDYVKDKVGKLQYWGNRDVPDSRPYQEEDKKKPGRKRQLGSLDELFLVLIRLKVGLFVKDLADRFGISMGHFSKIFTTWINFLYFELRLLFPFPPQDVIRRNMPLQFSLYPTTRVIIDCTEIFVEVPSSMTAQSQTWSNYKHHNTFKVLVGISPNGQVIFISKLWGGRVSDKYITDKSGLIQHLQTSDNVMADRGFDIQEILPLGVGLNIPPFKGTRAQLTAEEVDETVHIASVRIHVERAIGRIKNYHILDGTLPLSLAHVSDQIFSVCAYLTNFLPPLLPPKTPRQAPHILGGISRME